MLTSLVFSLSAGAESDYHRVINLHNQIVNSASGSNTSNLTAQIHELVGGNGNGISQKGATPVQLANLVHVLIYTALTTPDKPEQGMAHFLKAYQAGKVKGQAALNHLKSAFIVYFAARQDKALSEEERANLTDQALKNLHGEPYKQLFGNLTKDIIWQELKRLRFFEIYSLLIKGIKEEKFILQPEQAIDYKNIEAKLNQKRQDRNTSAPPPPPPPPPPPGRGRLTPPGWSNSNNSQAVETVNKPVPEYIQRDLETIKKKLMAIKELEINRQTKQKELEVLYTTLEAEKEKTKKQDPGIFHKLNLSSLTDAKKGVETLSTYLYSLKNSAKTINTAAKVVSSKALEQEKVLRTELKTLQDQIVEEDKKLEDIRQKVKSTCDTLRTLREKQQDVTTQETLCATARQELEQQNKVLRDLNLKSLNVKEKLKPYETPVNPLPAQSTKELETQARLTQLKQAYENINTKKSEIERLEGSLQNQKTGLKSDIETILQGKSIEETNFYEMNSDFKEAKNLTNVTLEVPKVAQETVMTSMQKIIAQKSKEIHTHAEEDKDLRDESEWD